jgi:hypothetical protein
MALYKSIVNTTHSDVDYVDSRSNLFYGKFQYRARLSCDGLGLLYFCKTPEDVIKKQQANSRRWKNIDPHQVIKFLDWKNQNQDLIKKKELTIRTEYNTSAIFSNDLSVLKTLDNLGIPVDYTIVDPSIPEGTMHFIKEPKFKYRFYLKSKRVPDDFHKKLNDFLDRYKESDSRMEPSSALKNWLHTAKHTSPNSYRWWKIAYLSSSFYINYNDESMITLFMLMFDGCVSRKYKLEKRPATT